MTADRNRLLVRAADDSSVFDPPANSRIPSRCVLCHDPLAGMWRLPPAYGWRIARVLLLCARCAEHEGAYCVHVDGLEDPVPSVPFVAAEDLEMLVAAGRCWCDEHTLVPWCPAHGISAADENAVRECQECAETGAICERHERLAQED